MTIEYNFRCGEIFFSENLKEFVFICKFCDEHFNKFEKFANHKFGCFPRRENVYFVEIIKTIPPAYGGIPDRAFFNKRKYYGSSNTSQQKSIKNESQSNFMKDASESDDNCVLIENDPIQEDQNNFDDEVEEITIEPNLLKCELDSLSDYDYNSDNVSQDADFKPPSTKRKKQAIHNDISEMAASTSVENFDQSQQSTSAFDSFDSFNYTESYNAKSTGGYPHQCRQCFIEFQTEMQLDCHIQSYHIDNDTNSKYVNFKPFSCTICNKRFTRFDYIKEHKRIQHGTEDCTEEEKMSDKKPYKCSDCSAEFTRNCDLKNHFRQHTGERPYDCRYCRVKFSASASRNKHEKFQHPAEYIPRSILT